MHLPSSQPAQVNPPESQPAPAATVAPAQRPTQGRIVIFTFPTGPAPTAGQVHEQGLKTCPAMITRVWNPECVNLQLLPDESQVVQAEYFQRGRPTSVSMGTGGRTWHWPERT